MKNWNLKRVITQVNTQYGAPMGRFNKGERPPAITKGRSCIMFKKHQPVIYTKHVPLIEGYDNGGVYWGIGAPLYVEFTPDLTYISFYRG